MALEKNIKLKVTADTKQAEQELDNVEVSAKDLQERISYLAVEMKKLEANFGKSGVASREYAMYQRELKYATQELINLEEKQDETTKKTVRGLGSLGSATMSAMGSISGLGTGISVLTNSLMSGAGLTAGLAGITIGFSLLMEQIRSANEETERFQKNIKDVIDVKMPGGSFKIAPENLQGVIDFLKMQKPTTEEMFTKSAGELSAMTDQLKTLNSTIKVLEDLNKEYKNQQDIIDRLTQAGLVYSETDEKYSKEKVKRIKEVNKGYEGQSDIIKMLDEQIKRQQETLKAFTESVNKIREGTYFKGKLDLNFVKQPKKPSIGFSSNDVMNDFYDENSFFIDQMKGDLNVLQGEFSKFWNKTFGEANSLLEMFLQNFAMGLADLAAKSLFSTILNFLYPGVGSIAGQAMGKTTNPTQVNLVLDDTTIAKVYITGKEKAIRLRMD